MDMVRHDDVFHATPIRPKKLTCQRFEDEAFQSVESQQSTSSADGECEEVDVESVVHDSAVVAHAGRQPMRQEAGKAGRHLNGRFLRLTPPGLRAIRATRRPERERRCMPPDSRGRHEHASPPGVVVRPKAS
jgi:hypothetical protein